MIQPPKAPQGQSSPIELVRSYMLDLIESSLEPGAQLPSELELIEQLGVSRSTLREVLVEFESAGLLERRWGVGTFVSPMARHIRSSMVNWTLTSFVPIMEMIRLNGREPGFKDYHYRKVEASGPVAQSLDLDEGSELWCMVRLYIADGHPAILVYDYLPTRFGRRSIDPEKFAGDLIEFLKTQAGRELSYGLGFMEARLAEGEVATELNLPAGTPLILFKQIAYAAGAGATVYTESWQHPQHVSHHFVRHGKKRR